MSAPGNLGGRQSQGGVIELANAIAADDMIPALGPIVAYPLEDGGQSPHAYDITGNFTGTYTGTPTYNVLGASTGAVRLNNATDSMTASGPLNQGTGSLELWVKIDALPASGKLGWLIGEYASSTKYSWALWIDDAGTLWHYGDHGGSAALVSSHGFPVAAWAHIIGVADGTHLKLFVNGISDGSAGFLGHRTDFASGASALYLGGAPLGGSWVTLPGSYDTAAIYAAVLTEAQVGQRYTQGGIDVVPTGPRIISAAAITVVTLAYAGSEADNGISPLTGLAAVTFSDLAAAIKIGSQMVAATTTIQLSETAVRHFDWPVSGTTTLSLAGVARNSERAVAAQSTVHLTPAAASHVATEIVLVAATAIHFSASASLHDSSVFVAAASRITFKQKPTLAQLRALHVGAASGLLLTPVVPEPAFFRAFVVAASSGLQFADLATPPTQSHALAVAAATALSLADLAAAAKDCAALAATTVSLADAGTTARDIRAAATTLLDLGVGSGSNQFLRDSGAGGLALTDLAAALLGTTTATGGLALQGRAFASVQLPDGGGVPGGDSGGGIRAVLMAGISGTYPCSYAETVGGLLLIANGIDPMIRWDGLAATAANAGIVAPTTAVALGGQAVGTITGIRYAYVRFVDRWGNTSDLGPVSNGVNMGRDALIDAIACDPSTGLITLTSPDHGLLTGEAVVIQGVMGLGVANGTHVVQVIDPDHFALATAAATSNTYTRGGSWTWGVAEVVYQAIPASTDPKVVRRQLLRNLDGSADVFYVDIDTTDMISEVLISTRLDDDLSAQEPVPLFGPDEAPLANRFGAPPSHKAVVASHLGRAFAAVDVPYTEGCVLPRLGQTTIRGVGTAWRANWVGRFLYVTGAAQSYEIVRIDEAAQVATLSVPYADPTAAFATYTIRSAPAERKLLYYSEPILPEAWPPWNAIAIPEDSDDITALVSLGTYLFIVEKRHIYRFTFQADPALGGNVFPSTGRGCINHRCWARVEDAVYMLDEAGIHRFDGDRAEPISTPIQSLFQPDGVGDLKVDWTADPTLWHAVHDPTRDTVRWFVPMVGTPGIVYAIGYDYRHQRFWIEQYPTPITASAVGTVGYRRSLVGTEARRILALGEGTLDGATQSYRGTATAADATSLTDDAASFPANLDGAPVAIVGGTGRGQLRMIAENTATSLTIVLPWDVTPDPTSTYQVGGIPWSWRSGWFEFMRQEEDNPRDVSVVYQPLRGPATAEVQLFFDHAETPRSWGYDQSQDGVTSYDGQPYIDIDLTAGSSRAGYSIQRFDGHADPYGYGDLFVSVLLSGVQAGEPVRVYRITISGASAHTEDQP